MPTARSMTFPRRMNFLNSSRSRRSHQKLSKNLVTLKTEGYSMTRFLPILCAFFALGAACSSARDAEMPTVRISENRKGFVLNRRASRSSPWGFNYDHDAKGRLIEDYWDDGVAEGRGRLREMKKLGANVVRIHLQFGKFMDGRRQAEREGARPARRSCSRWPRRPACTST